MKRIDYSQPWFEKRQGEWYCNLCTAWATEGHVLADKHQQRSKDPQWYGFGSSTSGGSGSAATFTPQCYNKPWFELRDGEYYCNLCSAWATEGHIGSAKHEYRASEPEHYGFGASSTASHWGDKQSAFAAPNWERHWDDKHGAWYYHDKTTGESRWEAPEVKTAPATSTAASAATHQNSWAPAASTAASADPQRNSWINTSHGHMLDYNKPWFEQREGEWYCNLCGKWATEGHVSSVMHTNRAATPDWYGFPCANLPAIADVAHNATPIAAVSSSASGTGQPAYTAPTEDTPPAPWEAHFSDEFQVPFYFNPVTVESVWELPKR